MNTFAWIAIMCNADMGHLRETTFTLEDAINGYDLYLLGLWN